MPTDTSLPPNRAFCLNIACPSQAGEVAAVVAFLDRHHGYIDEFQVFDDKFKQRFFVRCAFHTTVQDALSLSTLQREFQQIGRQFDMEWQIYDISTKPRVLIMVSRLDHCLNDLLFRWRMNELPMDITAVASNHTLLQHLAEQHGLPFAHLPITPETKLEQEEKLLRLVDETRSDLVVLARYMQVLSPATSKKLAGRAINIHHSFLPGFKGAKPYHQAYDRGVKVIGATAHFITDDLDEGPIIEQVVERVTNAHGPDQLLTVGRDMECQALARAVKSFIERRVFINGNRTILL
ncbi:formyltetrahydrofolate deformylase [Paralcaligenes ureilyticus]|nr:formyltetrahydrofolate deformylase [Paralcaligenes ureilyticus]